MMNDVQVSKNFKLREFACKCCDTVKLDSEMLEKLQKLREKLCKPITIHSGYRCPLHNKKIGGSPNSQHMLGKAVDLHSDDYGLTPDQLAELGKAVGFRGIGLYDWGCHFDVRLVAIQMENRKSKK